MHISQAKAILGNFFNSKIISVLNEISLECFNKFALSDFQIRSILFDYLTEEDNQIYGESDIPNEIYRDIINTFEHTCNLSSSNELIMRLNFKRAEFYRKLENIAALGNIEEARFDGIFDIVFRAFQHSSISNSSDPLTEYNLFYHSNADIILGCYASQPITDY